MTDEGLMTAKRYRNGDGSCTFTDEDVPWASYLKCGDSYDAALDTGM